MASSGVACNVCGAAAGPGVETARVRCNVRRFRAERFGVWRCSACRSIHAAEAIDLDPYYADYPSFPGAIERRLHPAYKGLLARLRAAGLRPGDSVLDYGCGSGALVRFLQQQGYRASGYDAYASAYRDEATLQLRYDAVVSQDVIEHVDAPLELLQRFRQLARPGGLVAIGTPDADAIDLSDPQDFVHALHAPYHRHILAAPALRRAAEALGFRLQRFYPTMYSNTWLPGQNPRFGLCYLRSHDDCLDLVTEPVRFSWKLCAPHAIFYALFGYLFDRHTDVMFTFRTPEHDERLARTIR